MLHKTRGIALSYIRYKETSIIARIYTEVFGIQSYVVNGVRSSKARTNRIALFQPLTLLDLVVYHKSKNDTLHRLSEVANRHPFYQIPFQPVKTALAIFLTEILGKTLREEEGNEELFNFLDHSVLALETMPTGQENFHIRFLLQLASYLGFGLESAGDFYKQLKDGHFTGLPDSTTLLHLDYFLGTEKEAPLKISRTERAALLSQILFFYKLHLDNLGEIKSLEVLREIMK